MPKLISTLTTGRRGVSLALILAVCGVVAAPAQASGSTATCPSNSIGSNFNGTAIPGGDTIWFNSVLKPSGATGGGVIEFRNQKITFVAGGTAYSIPVPDAEVIYSTSATTATTTFSGGQWVTTVPAGFGDNAFLSGVAFKVPSGGLPGGINPVTWTGDFTTSGSVGLSWQWGAAVYTTFSSNYNALGVKPAHSTSLDSYHSGDQAGTPESFTQYVTGGARGGGGANATGSYSPTGNCQGTPGGTPSIFVGYADSEHDQSTFGKTSIGSYFDGGIFANYKVVHEAALSASGSVTRLNLYAVPGINSPSSELVKAVIYADAGGSPGALLATGTEVSYSGNVNGSGWLELPFASPVKLSAGTYWLGFITGGASEGMGYAYDNAAGSRAYNANSYSSGPTNPFGASTEDSEQASIYATLGSGSGSFPSPWQGDAGVTFDGCGYGGTDSCPTSGGTDVYDAGAIRIDAPATAGGLTTVSNASVQIGSCSYNPWPGLNATIQPGNKLILTQTAKTPRCTSSSIAEQDNFDTSESFLVSPQYQQFLNTGSCTNDGYVPTITLTINGKPTTVRDTSQVLGNGGIDPDICTNRNEGEPWSRIQ